MAEKSSHENKLYLEDKPKLKKYISDFIEDNTEVGKKSFVDSIQESIEGRSSIQSIFKVPIKLNAFSKDTAQKWLFFIYVALRKSRESGDAPDGVGFNLKEALDYILEEYDLEADDDLSDDE